MKFFFNYMAMFNYGCEAIVRGTVNILSQAFDGDLEFVMPSPRPAYTKRKLADMTGFKVVPFSLFQRVKRIIRRQVGLRNWYKTILFHPRWLEDADCMLSVGGDLYTLTCGGDIPWILMGIGEYCLDHDIPYVIWGASIGPFEERQERLPVIIEHLKKTSLILSRDRMTVEYLAGKSIEDNVKQVADPAFCMEPEACDIERFLPKVKDGPIIGINFSPLAQRYYPEKAKFIPEIIRTCETVIKEFDASLVLVSHVISPFNLPSYDDREFHQKVYDEIAGKFKNRVGVVAEDIGSRKIKYLISQLDYFAGARMHSTIASLSTNIPTIFLAYSRKGEALSELLFGSDDWVIKIPDFDAEAFCEKLRRLMDEQDRVKSILEETIPKLKQQSLKGGEYLQDVLKQKHHVQP